MTCKVSNGRRSSTSAIEQFKTDKHRQTINATWECLWTLKE